MNMLPMIFVALINFPSLPFHSDETPELEEIKAEKLARDTQAEKRKLAAKAEKCKPESHYLLIPS
jgi:hypothetical protein